MRQELKILFVFHNHMSVGSHMRLKLVPVLFIAQATYPSLSVHNCIVLGS